MAATPEAKAKKYVRDILNLYAPIYYLSTVTGGFGRSGAPDITGCHNGRYFGIEVKADTELTELQRDNLDRVREAGGFAMVLRKNSQGVVDGTDYLLAFLNGAPNEQNKQAY
jgi:hypothetical protein